jgi:hypothetical protein
MRAGQTPYLLSTAARRGRGLALRERRLRTEDRRRVDGRQPQARGAAVRR